MHSLPILGISDPFSATTHLAGAFIGALSLRGLVERGAHSRWQYRSLWVFAASAIFLLTCSSLYHALPRGSDARMVLQRFDHAGIFLLIAGSFTASHGLFLRGAWRSAMTALIWVIGLSGLTLKVVFFEDISESTGLWLYVGMGWLGVVAMAKLTLSGVWRPAGQLALGGVVYTVGALGEFYGGADLHVLPGIVGSHELFRLAVLGGLGIHWKGFYDAAGNTASFLSAGASRKAEGAAKPTAPRGALASPRISG